jgi:predicted O-methyltransferase YrrM
MLSSRLSYEKVLQSLVVEDLEFLTNRARPLLQNGLLPEMSLESIEEILRLISPTTSHKFSPGKLSRWHRFLFAITRSVRPKTVVETGVLYGHSSAAILAALEDVGTGRLISIDLPPEKHRTVMSDQRCLQIGISRNGISVGSAVPMSLRSNWTLQFGNSLDVLPKILGEERPISMFVHDSLHTYDHMTAEFHLGYDALEPGGLLISDDIDYNSAWSDFCHSKREDWKALSKESSISERFGFLMKSNRAGRDRFYQESD